LEPSQPGGLNNPYGMNLYLEQGILLKSNGTIRSRKEKKYFGRK
jgi:hypothetical protein